MAKTDATRRRKRESKVVEEDIAHTVVSEEQTEIASSRSEEDSTTKSTDVDMTQVEEHQDKQVNGKQKAGPAVKNPPSKKTKVNNDGFCLFVGNLNSAKTYKEVNESLEKYFMSQCLLFQDIRLDRSRKRAVVHLASEMDLTKALALNGEMLLDKPMKITEAKIKSEDKLNVKAPSPDKKVNGKRKAEPVTENSPSKKTKVINDGFCLFIGNLNTSKKSEEVKESLEKYLMSQSLLFQDIRLDRSRKHAFVNVLSEMDLTKALALNGEMLLDKPMKIAKAKIKSEDQVKVKSPQLKKQAKDARCLFVKNLPYKATKQDILKIFHKAITVRFPGGTEGPSQGIAFVEFKNTSITQKVWKQKQGAKFQNRVLLVDRVGEANVCRVTKADVERNIRKDKKALQSSQNIKASKKEATAQSCEKPEKANVLSKTLIVMGLTEKTSAETLKSAFEDAVSARVIAKKREVSNRFGFVNFGSEESCKAAKEAMEDCEIDGRKVTIAYAHPKGKRSRQAQDGLEGDPAGQSVGQGAGKGGGKLTGKGRGGGTSQDAEVKQEN
ncbi:nucleolin-like isoform X2 [Archocentrus centrarchus]|uniref:nucleolin-like isoform X2 n=1 Tax=Archocentrus centrarchus TaxID=63155 RepID=UPI0011E9D90E|nr:nucleolin-like isoform X2 [Archocentrus centrarchus]